MLHLLQSAPSKFDAHLQAQPWYLQHQDYLSRRPETHPSDTLQPLFQDQAWGY